MSNEPELDVLAYFNLGCEITRHIHGIPRTNVFEAMLGVVKDIVNGDLTLVDTPEEVTQALGDDKLGLAKNVAEALREMRAEQRAAAVVIWQRFVSLSEGKG